jgi:uncharacterized protein (DUF2164 family)
MFAASQPDISLEVDLGVIGLYNHGRDRDRRVAHADANPNTQRAEGQLLDHLMQEIGPYFYNQAMEDARAVVLRKSSEIEDELYALEKPIKNRRR